MRATLPRFVRTVTRKQLKAEYADGANILRPSRLPEPGRSDVKPPTLIDILMKRKEELGADYPPNIRIEPVLAKETFKGVPPEAREELKELLRER